MYEADSIEIDITEHCNLRCAQCTHNAPYFKTSDTHYTLEQFKKDIDILSNKIHFNAIRLVGGEPLLNNDLVEMLEHITNSKITNQIVLVTNGILLSDTPRRVFELVSSVRVNIYPLSADKMQSVKDGVLSLRSSHPELDVITNVTNYFSKTNTIEKITDEALVNKIYSKCIARVDGFNLFNGRIYRCYASRRKYKYLKQHQHLIKDDFEYLNNPDLDAIRITTETSDKDFHDFFVQSAPPVACQWCLGCSGKQLPHKQLQDFTNDIATLKDLDFKAGEAYLSNCILSWSHLKPSSLKNNPFFKMEHVKEYYKYFTTSPF